MGGCDAERVNVIQLWVQAEITARQALCRLIKSNGRLAGTPGSQYVLLSAMGFIQADC